MRAATSVCLAIALSVVVEAASRAGIQHSRPITALVTVLAPGAAPVSGLTAADFTVYEGTARREVVAAALSDDPLSVAMLVDTTQPTMGSQAPVRDLRTS